MKYKWHAVLRNRIVMITAASCFILAALFLFTSYLESSIASAIQKNKGTVESVDVNLTGMSVSLGNLSLLIPGVHAYPDSQYVRARLICLKGISLYEYLIHHTFHVNKLVVDSADIHYAVYQQLVPGKTTGNSSLLFHADEIYIHDMIITVDSRIDERFSTKLTGTFRNITFNPADAGNYQSFLKAADFLFTDIVVSHRGGMYSTRIESLRVNTVNKSIQLDSIQLTPRFSKYEFARHLGRRTARLQLLVDRVDVEGVNFKAFSDSVFMASMIRIQNLDVSSFKDKRIASQASENRPLPMEEFLMLRSYIKIDSISLINSRVLVEEFPSEAKESGYISFENINALLTGLNNRIEKNMPQQAMLSARGTVMGTGSIDAVFYLPLDLSTSYFAKGTISNVNFEKLNPILKTVDMRIKSGYVNKLIYSFTYTDKTSHGEVDVDYKNLIVQSLKKKERSIDELRSFVLNALVKNNGNRPDKSVRRIGHFHINRNRKLYIFNVWSQSLVAGLISSITGKNATTEKRL